MWGYLTLKPREIWRLINWEHVTTEEEPSFDISSGRDDELLAADDDDTKDVAYNAIAMGFQLEYKRLERSEPVSIECPQGQDRQLAVVAGCLSSPRRDPAAAMNTGMLGPTILAPQALAYLEAI